MRAVRTFALVVLALAFPASALAQRTDVIVLENGDTITGEVLELSRGQLMLKTDDAGTLTIKWDKVVSLKTTLPFDVETADGPRFVGRIDAAPDVKLSVFDAYGSAIVTLSIQEIVSLTPIGKSFLSKIDGSVDFGGSYTQSSGVVQISFDGIATYRQPAFEATANLSMAMTRQPEVEDTGRFSAGFGYRRVRANGLVVNPLALFERNADLGFNFRYTGALSLGRFLVHTNRGTILLGAGAALGRETPVEGTDITNVDALISFNAALFAYDYPKTNIDCQALVFPSLNDIGRVRLNTNVKFKRELLKDFYFAVTGYDSYDNRPPSASAKANDVGFSLALGWSF